MAYEEAKAYLKRYEQAQISYERACFRVQRLEARIGASGVNYDGMPHGSTPKSPTEAAAIMLVDAKQRRNAKWEEVLEAYDSVQSMIESLEDTMQRAVLAYRYLEGMAWDEIAAQLNYAERSAHRVHAEALCEVHLKLGGFDK